MHIVRVNIVVHPGLPVANLQFILGESLGTVSNRRHKGMNSW